MHIRTHTTTQTRRYTNIEKHIQEHIQPQKHSVTHTYKNTYKNTYNHTNTQIHAYKNTYTHICSQQILFWRSKRHTAHTRRHAFIHSFITSIYIAPLQVGLLKGVHTYIHIQEKHTRRQHSGEARGTYFHPCIHIRTHTTTYTRRYTHTNTHKRRFTHIQTHIHAHASIQILMNRAHSFFAAKFDKSRGEIGKFRGSPRKGI